MPLYETVIPGEVRSYPRANRVELINTDPPEARIHAVDRTTYPDGTVVDRNPVQLDIIVTDPAVEIPLIDPIVQPAIYPVSRMQIKTPFRFEALLRLEAR